MKKLLKLLFALSTAATLPLTAIACQTDSLDSGLNVILNGDTKYDISLIGKKIDANTIDSITLSTDEAGKLAKAIANEIVKKSDSEATIAWFGDEDIKTNENCYNFSIKNGEKKDENKDEITWTVKQDSQNFTFEVHYLVGSTNSENKFVAKQEISKLFYIKAGTSFSDKVLQDWVSNFNKKGWTKTSPLKINLEGTDLKLPEANKSWSDLDKSLIEKVNQTIQDNVADITNDSNIVRWKIESTNTSTTDELTLELKLSCNYGDSQDNTNNFFIKFVK